MMAEFFCPECGSKVHMLGPGVYYCDRCKRKYDLTRFMMGGGSLFRF